MDLIGALAALHPQSSRVTLKQWLASGRIQVNGEVVRRGTSEVAPGDRVALAARASACALIELPGQLRIVHENDRLLVIDKPAGLLTIATAKERDRTAYRFLSTSLAERAAAQNSEKGYGRAATRGREGAYDRAAARGREREHERTAAHGREEGYDRAEQQHGKALFIVHRLDRETSGLLVFAKTVSVKHALQEQFAQRTAERVYIAVVEGRVRDDAGILRMRLREDSGLRVRVAPGQEGRDATTHYRVLARGPDSTRLEVRLETGRRGQIRAHLAAFGHPILGDAAYGSRRDPLRRVCLHASALGFLDGKEQVKFVSPVPAAFVKRVG